MLKPLSRDTLTQQATDTLRRFVLTEELQSGDQLPSERDLSESLSVSRNIVREALSVLVADGLIEKKAGRGIFVREHDRSQLAQRLPVSLDSGGHNLEDLSEARATVEIGSAALMVERVTAAQIADLETINRNLAVNLHEGRSTVKDDIEFHKVLFQATHNAVLIDLIPLLVEHFRLTVFYQPGALRRSSQRIVDDHQRIIDALRAHDVDALRRALLAHPLR